MVYRPVQLASGYQSLAGIGFASGFLVSLDGFLVSLDGFSGWFLGFLVSLVSSAETFFHPSFTSLFLNLAPEMSNPFSSINH